MMSSATDAKARRGALELIADDLHEVRSEFGPMVAGSLARGEHLRRAVEPDGPDVRVAGARPGNPASSIVEAAAAMTLGCGSASGLEQVFVLKTVERVDPVALASSRAVRPCAPRGRRRSRGTASRATWRAEPRPTSCRSPSGPSMTTCRGWVASPVTVRVQPPDRAGAEAACPGRAGRGELTAVRRPERRRGGGHTRPTPRRSVASAAVTSPSMPGTWSRGVTETRASSRRRGRRSSRARPASRRAPGPARRAAANPTAA